MINDNTPREPGATVSEQYLLNEVGKVRASLKNTRIACIIAVVGTYAYLGITTAKFQQYIEPVSAAEMTKVIISQKVLETGPQLIDEVKQQIPILIAQVPDYAQQQLPVYRVNMENQFEKVLTTNLNKGSADLDTKLDTYLMDNKDQIKSVLTSTQDPTAVNKLGDGLSREFMDSLKTTTIDGETIQSKLDSSLDSLRQVQKKMNRLATAKNLTPEEKKTRHAIAIMTKIINRETPAASGISEASISVP